MMFKDLPIELQDKCLLNTNLLTALQLNANDYIINKLYKNENKYWTISTILNFNNCACRRTKWRNYRYCKKCFEEYQEDEENDLCKCDNVDKNYKIFNDKDDISDYGYKNAISGYNEDAYEKKMKAKNYYTCKCDIYSKYENISNEIIEKLLTILKNNKYIINYCHYPDIAWGEYSAILIKVFNISKENLNGLESSWVYNC
jgi:hypothetical protein